MSGVPRPEVTERRPNPKAKWVCGYQHLGMACSEGPSERGVCCQVNHGRDATCAPDTCDQHCTEASDCKLAGLRQKPHLPSHQQLGPCIPQKASWFTRQTLSLNIAILSSGILLLCMALPQRESVFVPGPLSQKHAQILENHLVSQRCSLCHPNSHTEAMGLVGQDELCLHCHQSHMPDAVLRRPHDLTLAQFDSLLDEANPPRPMGQLVSTTNMRDSKVSSRKIDEQTSCAACHVEHHGAAFELTAMSDASCQACHQNRFASLSNGHPQFNGYPYRTDRRIAFDHIAHEQKHFGTKGEKFECGRCHVDRGQEGPVGSVFRSLGFERACASCHADAIRSATITGWAVLQTPSIEAEDANQSALGLSDWPSGARFGYEGEISVPLRLLLAADPAAAAALAKLPSSGKLNDIPLHLADRAMVSRSLAVAFRNLVADIAAGGQSAWKQRLVTTAEQALGRDLTASETGLIDELSSGLPPDLFRQIQRKWFGENTSVVAEGVAKVPVRMVSEVAPGDRSSKAGDRPSDDASAAAAQVDSLLLTEAADDALLDQTTDDLLLGDHLLDDTLSNNDLSSRDLLDQSSADDLLGDSSLAADLGMETDPPVSRSTQLTKLQGSVHVAEGGWYLDDELLALRYMPRGHADRTLAAWAQYVVLIQSAPVDSAGGTLGFKQNHASKWERLTLGESMLEGCTQCHLLGSGSKSVSDGAIWQSVSRNAKIRPFTKFDHNPHLTLPALSDCRYCHQLDVTQDQKRQDVAYVLQRKSEMVHGASSLNSAGASLGAEFTPMQRNQCVACHPARRSE